MKILAAALVLAVLLGSCDTGTGSDKKKNEPDPVMYTFSAVVSESGNGTVSWTPEGTQFTEGTRITVTATGSPGYSLVSWTDGTGTVASSATPYSFTLQADTALTAHFDGGYAVYADIPHATVTLDPPGPLFDPGTEVTVSLEAEDGYAFCGWTSGASGNQKTVQLTVGSESILLDAVLMPRWTALIHVAVDNNIDFIFEPEFGVLTNYLSTLESIEAADTFDVMDIYVLMDGYDKTDPRDEGYTTPFTDGYYKLTGGDFSDDLVNNTGEINSGSVAVTKAFMDFAMADSKSVRTFYSVFNHGGGFDDYNDMATYGIGFDDSNDDALSHKELAQVTAYLKTLTGKNIDVFFPYACLMGGVELAYEIRNNVDVMVASEEVFPAELWSWEALAEAVENPLIESLDLGAAFCDSALEYFTNVEPRTFTLATVDLSKIGSLSIALDSFATAALSWIGNDATRAARFDMAATTGLYMYTPYYTDIGEFMDRVRADAEIGSSVKNAIPSVEAMLSAAVTHFTTADADDGLIPHGEAEGLSIFHAIWASEPYGFYYNPTTYASILEFGKSNAWSNYAKKLDALKVVPLAQEDDQYEPDNDENTTNVLLPGLANQQYHTFSDLGANKDYDFMIVNLTAGITYTFETFEGNSADSDTYMALVSPAGTILDEDDDAGDGLYSKITHTPATSGAYFLVVWDEYRGYGDYRVFYDAGTWGPTLSEPAEKRKWVPRGLVRDTAF